MCCSGKETQTAVDPVCGMTIDPGKTTEKSKYRGATYLFCALGCKAEFERTPEKYVRPDPLSEVAQVRENPIRDPVCGMDVDPATAARVEYLGCTYSFCSQHCATKFRAEPGRYL